MRGVLALALAVAGCSTALAAEGGVWSVSKSSGEVWLTTTGATPTSLTQETTLAPGDTVRTGPHGRVLLTRGQETILVSANSVIGLPTEQKDGLPTTILQRAGSILLDVEKRNVKHFEVETPYLAAVVKGTHFQVTVNASDTRVDVQRGQVEVADFRTGQIALVMPGQAATSFVHGRPGLLLSGSGTFNPIEQGKPRASTIERISVPRGGLHAPRGAGDGKSIRALGPAGAAKLATAMSPHVIRLTKALGEIHLNVHKATHGLAHGAVVPGVSGKRDTARDTIWNDNRAVANSNANASANNANGNGNGSWSGSIAAPGMASPAAAGVTTAATVAPGNNGNANGATGNGNNGNHFANGNGNGGAGNANANGAAGNGNNGNHFGNGNGNGGVGNGNGNGNAKH
jgi:hypothetical protein